MANPTGAMKNKGEERPGSISGSTETRNRPHEETGSMAEKARDLASTAGEKVRDVASNVGQKAEDATSAVASSMKSLAGTIRESVAHGGMLGAASSTVASTLESSGRYLQEEGLRGIGEDLTQLIRRNPIPALLLGVGLGYLLAQTRRS